MSSAFLVDVALVVLVIPARVLRHPGCEGRSELVGSLRLGVEVDDERLVLRVDQVVGARCPDLAHLGCAAGRCERDCFRAPVELEHDALGVCEQRTAENG